jgi:hypothetical protein
LQHRGQDDVDDQSGDPDVAVRLVEVDGEAEDDERDDLGEAGEG